MSSSARRCSVAVGRRLRQINGLDALVRLIDDGLERRDVSEEARSTFWDELAKNLKVFTNLESGWSPEIPLSIRKPIVSEYEKIVKVLTYRHRFFEGPFQPDGFADTWTWQCIRCGMLPCNLRQGCPTCGLTGWLKRVPI